jgi:hypothetical protein
VIRKQRMTNKVRFGSPVTITSELDNVIRLTTEVEIMINS